MDDDNDERVLSGKLSESSGYDGSDLYEYKVFVLNFIEILVLEFSICMLHLLSVLCLFIVYIIVLPVVETTETAFEFSVFVQCNCMCFLRISCLCVA